MLLVLLILPSVCFGISLETRNKKGLGRFLTPVPLQGECSGRCWLSQGLGYSFIDTNELANDQCGGVWTQLYCVARRPGRVLLGLRTVFEGCK